MIGGPIGPGPSRCQGPGGVTGSRSAEYDGLGPVYRIVRPLMVNECGQEPALLLTGSHYHLPRLKYIIQDRYYIYHFTLDGALPVKLR